jgi:hypothetical protein
MSLRIQYWLDADVYIQASRGPYKRFPEFWAFLSDQLERGRIKSPKVVYGELTKHWNDELKKWCVTRKDNGLCISASREVQKDCMGKIVDYVYKKYLPHQSSEFLQGGDAWVIAHAMHEKDAGVVVTQESLRKFKSKIKLPTISKAMEVKYINTYDLLDALDFKPENYKSK